MKKKSLILIAIIGTIVIIGSVFGYMKHTATSNKETVVQKSKKASSKTVPVKATNSGTAQVCVLYISNYNPPTEPNYILTSHGGVAKYDKKKCESSKSYYEAENKKYSYNREYKCVCGDNAFIEKFEKEVCGRYEYGCI
jgi:hypothetical protein